MTRMFCTLKEAAQTLQASEDQVNALLEQGLLQEFREGPHRLVRETEVGALAQKRRRHRPAQPPVPRLSPAAARSKANRPASSRRPRTVKAAAPPPRSDPPASDARRAARQEPRIRNCAPRRENPVPAGPRQLAASLPAARAVERLSVRQWFWMGLVQDRPAVIALLSGLILLLLAALVAGLCFAADQAVFR
ncbi:MAG: hypothetical protein FJ280_15470 [Planctomycetes bacterium]|nr:hypothetical protein [Planctomycetota bacterium]